MAGFTKTLVAGAVGSITTNLLHEATRRSRPDAPRVDLLGMQALAKGLSALDVAPPTGRDLYVTTLLGDLVSNAGYFALIGLAPHHRSVSAGALLGVAAGIGAVTLPQRLGLAVQPTNRTRSTQAMTVALYTLGGIAAGCVRRGLSRA